MLVVLDSLPLPSGMAINTGGGASSDDDFVVDTDNIASFLLVDASEDSLTISGDMVVSGTLVTDMTIYNAQGTVNFSDTTEDYVLTWNDTTKVWAGEAATGAPATADISDVSVTQTELAELETIGDTSIGADDWVVTAALGGLWSGDDLSVAGDLLVAGTIESSNTIYVVGAGDSGVSFGSVTSDPCGGAPAFASGTIFYNGTSGYMCFCNNSDADIKMNDNSTACF